MTGGEGGGEVDRLVSWLTAHIWSTCWLTAHIWSMYCIVLLFLPLCGVLPPPTHMVNTVTCWLCVGQHTQPDSGDYVIRYQ